VREKPKKGHLPAPRKFYHLSRPFQPLCIKLRLRKRCVLYQTVAIDAARLNFFSAAAACRPSEKKARAIPEVSPRHGFTVLRSMSDRATREARQNRETNIRASMALVYQRNKAAAAPNWAPTAHLATVCRPRARRLRRSTPARRATPGLCRRHRRRWCRVCCCRRQRRGWSEPHPGRGNAPGSPTPCPCPWRRGRGRRPRGRARREAPSWPRHGGQRGGRRARGARQPAWRHHRQSRAGGQAGPQPRRRGASARRLQLVGGRTPEHRGGGW